MHAVHACRMLELFGRLSAYTGDPSLSGRKNGSPEAGSALRGPGSRGLHGFRSRVRVRVEEARESTWTPRACKMIAQYSMVFKDFRTQREANCVSPHLWLVGSKASWA